MRDGHVTAPRMISDKKVPIVNVSGLMTSRGFTIGLHYDCILVVLVESGLLIG
jgi:hypothetical protein